MPRPLPRLEARLHALGTAAAGERAAALESLLNDGYGEVLGLEGERARRDRRVREMAAREGEPGADEDLRRETARLRELDDEIAQLRELLDRAWALGPAGRPA